MASLAGLVPYNRSKAYERCRWHSQPAKEIYCGSSLSPHLSMAHLSSETLSIHLPCSFPNPSLSVLNLPWASVWTRVSLQSGSPLTPPAVMSALQIIWSISRYKRETKHWYCCGFGLLSLWWKYIDYHILPKWWTREMGIESPTLTWWN